jgi:hypothetical protein
MVLYKYRVSENEFTILHIFIEKIKEPEQNEYRHVTAELSRSFTYDTCSIERI